MRREQGERERKRGRERIAKRRERRTNKVRNRGRKGEANERRMITYRKY